MSFRTCFRVATGSVPSQGFLSMLCASREGLDALSVKACFSKEALVWLSWKIEAVRAGSAERYYTR